MRQPPSSPRSKRMRADRSQRLDRPALSADNILPLLQVVKLLSEPLVTRAVDLSVAKKRVRSHIDHALKETRELAYADDRQGMFRVGSLASWAQRKWPGKFGGLPSDPALIEGRTSLGALRASATAIAVPTELGACQESLLAIAAKCIRLEHDLAIALEEVAKLRPQLEKKAKRSAQCKRDGGKRPNTI